MPNSLYIAAFEPATGKSLISLGVCELISHRVHRLGFFRPTISGGDQPNAHIELIRSRFSLAQSYERMYSVTNDEAAAYASDGRFDELLKTILLDFKTLQRDCDFVVCEGTDFSGVHSAFQYDFDARVANQLGCPILIVASGKDRSPADIVSMLRSAREAFAGEQCTIAATSVNRVAPEALRATHDELARRWTYDDPVFLIPDVPQIAAPTIGEVAAAAQARVLYSEQDSLLQDVRGFRVAAMQLPNFLDFLADGELVITPGDRADIILGSLATAYSDEFPQLSGLLLTGGLTPPPQVQRLIDGLPRRPWPILLTSADTFTTATRVSRVQPVFSADNPRKLATALGVFEQHVDGDALVNRINVSRSTIVTPLMFEYELIELAKADRQHIVLPEGHEERILRAAEMLLRRGVVDLTLLGQERELRAKIASLGLDLEAADVVDPLTSPWHEDFARTYFELRQHKGVNLDVAADRLRDVSYFGTMMVYKGLAGGMVSGSVNTTAHTIRPALEFVRTKPGCAIVSSVLFMCLADRVLVYGDCAVNPNPTAEQLADIAVSSAETARMFGVTPKIAMLSYSTGQSGHGEDVDRVREATRLARQARPDLKIEGPIQYDAAVDASVARTKLPDSEVAGQATVFVFPDLNTGNNTYKAVQRSAGAVVIGPVMQGLNKPVNDLSRGCTIPDIVNTVAITAIQAQPASEARL